MDKEERRRYYRDLSISAKQQDRIDRRTEQRRSWDARRYKTVSCRVPVETARRFQRLCYRHGKTPYRALKDAVEAALRHDGE